MLSSHELTLNEELPSQLWYVYYLMYQIDYLRFDNSFSLYDCLILWHT